MFKQRKHRTFNYKPRFTKINEGDSGLDASGKSDFVSKWKEAQSGKRKLKGGVKLTTLILVLVLLLICMYLLEKRYL
ncbi:hypothetical protein [Aestuariivivens marinum]|uniref:hypothetical protein n=1 Tax=Aestuariivivens marinum TaxID=2913555 RepID=UPI001F573866|nr:hypothetical protein [Aestuariivivens marinum]